jgi:ABC-type polysaccharide/polyol phosphate transport system ATPase subunit
MNVQRAPAVVPGQPLVELRNVSRRFEKKLERRRSLQDLFIRIFQRHSEAGDDFWPLRDISFSIQAGDCVGVIGPNGSGKSTLLKVISGILEPTSGELSVRGRISSLLELGAGFQPDLTGRENIYLNGSIYGLSRVYMNQHIDSIVDYAELGEFIDTPVKHYSSGMYVRLGFAVAIHTQPDLLLVDEVLAVGDVTFQHKCMKSIYQFRRNGGTLLLVAHDLGAIQNLCTHALWLDGGLIAGEGNPTDVVMAYLNTMAQREERESDKAGMQMDGSAANQRWGSGRIQIRRVALCDAAGASRSVFLTGDTMQVQIHYYSAARVESPIFGIAIHHQNGVHICGPNTRLGGMTIPYVEGDGIVTYHIPTLPLLEGDYAVSAAVVNQSDTETFDYHDRAYPFRVFPSPMRDGYGLLTLRGEWMAGNLPTKNTMDTKRDEGTQIPQMPHF